MYAKQDARLYAHVQVWFWPWLWWQLWHLKAWIIETGFDVAVAVDQRGNLRVTYVSDDPYAPKRWKAEHLRELVRPFAEILREHEGAVTPAELVSCDALWFGPALSGCAAAGRKRVPAPLRSAMNRAQGWDPPWCVTALTPCGRRGGSRFRSLREHEPG